MATKSSSSDKPVIGENGADVIAGTLSLTDGLVYDSEGKVIERTGDPDKEIVQTEQIGAFKREVYADGSVATFQTKPLNSSSELNNGAPIPAPGGQQDQAGAGLSDPKAK